MARMILRLRDSQVMVRHALVLVAVLLAIAVVSYIVFSQVTVDTANVSTSRHDRLASGFHLAASTRSAAFPVMLRSGNTSLIFIEFNTGKRTRLVSQKSYLLAPFLSQDGSRLLFVRQSQNERGHELVLCNTSGFVCKSVLKSNNSIVSPIEISVGNFLYASSPYLLGGDGKGRYARNDFWILEGAGVPRQLTDMQLYQLNSISVTENEVYFSAYGPQPDRPVIPRTSALDKENSDIFKLPFDLVKGEVSEPRQMLAPMFRSSGLSTQLNVSPTGSLMAFLRTSTDKGNYRYDLVIVNREKQQTRLIESRGLGFSRPVIVAGSVAVSELTNSGRTLKMFASDGSTKVLADVDDASIDAIDVVEIQIQS